MKPESKSNFNLVNRIKCILLLFAIEVAATDIECKDYSNGRTVEDIGAQQYYELARRAPMMCIARYINDNASYEYLRFNTDSLGAFKAFDGDNVYFGKFSGLLNKSSKRVGTWFIYDSTGQLDLLKQYNSQGLSHGKEITYNTETGFPKTEVIWENGHPLWSMKYNSEGIKTWKGRIDDNNISNGPDSIYFDNGLLLVAGNRINGSPTGIWKNYNESGKLISEGSYNKSGLQEGEWTIYRNDGSTFRIAKFENGKEIEGRLFVDNSGGLAKYKCDENGEIEGLLKIFVKGKFVRTMCFHKGNQVEDSFCK